jgi:hypothetical protein
MNRKFPVLNLHLALFVFLFVLVFTARASELSVPEIVNKVQPTIVVIESKKASDL